MFHASVDPHGGYIIPAMDLEEPIDEAKNRAAKRRSLLLNWHSAVYELYHPNGKMIRSVNLEYKENPIDETIKSLKNRIRTNKKTLKVLEVKVIALLQDIKRQQRRINSLLPKFMKLCSDPEFKEKRQHGNYGDLYPRVAERLRLAISLYNTDKKALREWFDSRSLLAIQNKYLGHILCVWHKHEFVTLYTDANPGPHSVPEERPAEENEEARWDYRDEHSV